MEANGTDTNGREYWGEGKVTIKEANATINLSLVPAGDLIVKLQRHPSACQTEFSGQLGLEPIKTRNPKTNWQEMESFTIFNLRNRPYRLLVESHSPRLYLASKTYPLSPTNEAQEIHLFSNGGIVRGEAKGNIMQLLPVDGGKITFQQTPITGNAFTFTNVAPGTLNSVLKQARLKE